MAAVGGKGYPVSRRDLGSHLGTGVLSHVKSYFQLFCLKVRDAEKCVFIQTRVFIQKCVFRSRYAQAAGAGSPGVLPRRAAPAPGPTCLPRGAAAAERPEKLREQPREPQPCSAAKWTTASASSSRTAWRSGSGACSWWWETAARTRYRRPGAETRPCPP